MSANIGRLDRWRYGRRNITLELGCTLELRDGMDLGEGTCLDSGVHLVGCEDGRSRLTIGTNTVIRSGTYISARRGSVGVGANSYVGHGSWIGGRGIVSIGPWFLCAPKVVIISSNHNYRNTEVPYALQEEVAGEIHIGENIWIGANSVILPGARIGDRAVVAAGSVVRSSVEPGTLVAGVPARFVRELSGDDEALGCEIDAEAEPDS